MKLLIELDEEYVKVIDEIKFLIGGRTNRKLQLEIIKAIKNGIPLEQEPTTKNDLVVDCISREAVERIINKWLSHSDYELKDHIYSMTEKIHNLPSVTPQFSSELEKNSKKLEKDFGESDCISRADAIKAMQDKAKKLKNEDTINGLCGAVAILFNLPSVTPQEPMQVDLEGDGYADGELVYDYGKCPKCGWEFEEGDKDWEQPYCCHCGQKLKWFDNEAESEIEE